jgi:hypothetical protein
MKLASHRFLIRTGQYNHINKQYKNYSSSTQGLIKKAALSVADVFKPVTSKCNEQFWNLLGLPPGVCHGQLKSSPLACKNSYSKTT